MKAMLILVAAVMLCACADAPQVHTSMRYNGQSMPSMDMTDPRFYMDDDRPAPELAAPAQVHSVDGLCASSCLSRGGPAGYCDRACGF
ncbi:MAG TPA: hypothetical protein VMH32_14540 [Burkholderiales bacterium]|nr:hypothetical protein [Burkholderiales bacterium]